MKSNLYSATRIFSISHLRLSEVFTNFSSKVFVSEFISKIRNSTSEPRKLLLKGIYFGHPCEERKPKETGPFAQKSCSLRHTGLSIQISIPY